VPALVSMAIWIYIYLSAPIAGNRVSTAFLTAAVIAYAVFNRAPASSSSVSASPP
jgi:hypothetical protein